MLVYTPRATIASTIAAAVAATVAVAIVLMALTAGGDSPAREAQSTPSEKDTASEIALGVSSVRLVQNEITTGRSRAHEGPMMGR